MLLVIPAEVLDRNLDKLRDIQEHGYHCNGNEVLEDVINDLCRESVDITQSIVRGRKEIMEMM